MIDSAKITVRSGNGGNGIVSFAREPHNPLAGPSGGNGGNGGDVIFVSETSVKTLSIFSYKRHFLASNGGNGGTTKKQGFSGEEIKIQVPVGTVLSFKNENGIVETVDLNCPKKQIILIKGGRGGLGNAKFTSSINREPLLAESGEVGKEIIVSLELKLLADVGIVGMPNAGKSSLLRSITSAKPKIGDYPFTTLEPKLGTVINDFEEFVVVDIPGLIKDAHIGVGIGHDFLKHIQRTKILIHLVDGTSENIPENINIINNEMKNFDKTLLDRPQILVINKADLDDVEILKDEILVMIKNANINLETFFISALSMKGINALLRSITKKIEEVKTEEISKFHQTKTQEINIIHPRIKKEIDSVIKESEDQYRIIHPRAIRIAEGSDLNDWSTLIQFQGRLERMGVNGSLRKLGIKQGDTVVVSEWNFEWNWKNLGIFGGSFDPIHNGHIKISLLAQKQLNLDILLFIPVYDQWMKNRGPYASSKDRLDMINVSISNLKNIEICDIDIKRKKHTYTIDTLNDLIKLYPKVEKIYLIVGEDSINKMDKWYKSEEINFICTIAVYKRKNKKNLAKSFNYFYKNIINITGPRIDISSTKIREYIDKNLSIESLVPRQVEEIIIKRELYKS